MSANMESIFYQKAQAILRIARDRVWRTHGYTVQEKLTCEVSDDAKTIIFRRTRENDCAVRFTSVTPADLLNIHTGTPTTLKQEQIDATHQTIDNRTGKDPIKEEYSGTFEKTESASEAISAGASLSISATFKEGGDASPVSAEQSIETEIHSEWSKTTDKGEAVSRTVTYEIEVQPGEYIDVFATRSIDKIKQTIYGTGDFHYGIGVGKFSDGRFHGDFNEGYATWSSLDDFILAATGHSPDNFGLAASFKKQPAYSSDVHWAQTPLNAPFEEEIIYDDVTTTHLVEQSLIKAGGAKLHRMVERPSGLLVPA